MPFADELLGLARDLAGRQSETLREVSLRRAVSTAYYALFHLLISEATLNWGRAELRPALGRLFEHGKMASASERMAGEINAYFKKKPPEGPELTIAKKLYIVVNTFVEAQQSRNAADYDTSRVWTQVDALDLIALVEAAFESWNAIREEPVAQAYLVSLLGKDRARG
jgi:hypothetical protein